MREALDTFASVGTSNVFFQLVLGRTTPKEISGSLKNQQPPSVMEHLNKLREMGVIEREEKEGKSQPYEINWKKFVDEFLERVSTAKRQNAALKLDEGEEYRSKVEKEQKDMKEVMGELRRNELFRAIVRDYFERLAKSMEMGLYPERTIWGAIYCFEESLESPKKMKGGIKNPELLKLLDLLDRWDECNSRFEQYHGPAAALDYSIQKLAGGGPR